MAPHLPGTLVRGVTPDGIPVRQSCRKHIFETLTEAVPVTYACGFIQSARCLICCYSTTLIDADFWHKEVDAFDLAGAMGEIHAIRESLDDAQARIEQAWLGLSAGQSTTRPALKDFG